MLDRTGTASFRRFYWCGYVLNTDEPNDRGGVLKGLRLELELSASLAFDDDDDWASKSAAEVSSPMAVEPSSSDSWS